MELQPFILKVRQMNDCATVKPVMLVKSAVLKINDFKGWDGFQLGRELSANNVVVQPKVLAISIQ